MKRFKKRNFGGSILRYNAQQMNAIDSQFCSLTLALAQKDENFPALSVHKYIEGPPIHVVKRALLRWTSIHSTFFRIHIEHTMVDF